MDDEQRVQPPPRVTAVAIKLPPYWSSDPQVWFAQVEAQFATRGINNQRTMFDYVIASLSPEVATEIRDLILTPPNADQYTALKEQLIQRTAVSEQRRIQQLLGSEELGDRKPSQFLRRLQQLAGDTVRNDGAFLRQLFLQRLPPNVRMVLASAGDNTQITELANTADRIMEAGTSNIPTVFTPNISAVSPSPLDMTKLQAEITCLKDEIKLLRRSSSDRSSRDRSSRDRSPRRRSPSPVADAASVMCWYHQQFGSSAVKCRPPCSYSGNSQAGR